MLLLEAGPPDRSLILRMPAALGLPLQDDRFNWRFESEPDPGTGGRTSLQHRGRVLGGTSSINGMVFNRGNPLDYDAWAELGLTDWSYAHCLPYFKRLESFEGGADLYRGADGPVRVVVSRAANPLYEAFLQAGEQFGLPLTPDQNGQRQEGVHRTQVNVDHGVRASSSAAYLRRGIDPAALTTGAKTTVQDILFDNNRAIGVTYLSEDGTRKTAYADREVILSAGVFGSPQLLMLSGIGDADHLRTHGIRLRRHLPGVGRNLQDHIAVGLSFSTRQAVSPIRPFSTLGRLALGLRWIATKRGFGTTNHFEVGAFLRTNEAATHPNIQLEFCPMIGEFYRGRATVRPGFQYWASIMRPSSLGEVALRSANPSDALRIRMNFLADQRDVTQLTEAVRSVRQIVRQSAWAPLCGEETTDGRHATSNPDLEQWIRSTAGSGFHGVGTCRMGADSMAVTDTEGRVHGVQALRVIDASIMPRLVSGNTNAPTMMIAEKLSDRILGKALPPENAPFYRAH